MKGRVWLLTFPLIALWTAAFLIVERGDQGALESQAVRTRIYPTLRAMAGFATDVKFRLRGPTPPRNKIVVVEIDDAAIEAVGRWPWHRDAVAILIHEAFAAGAKAVGLDIIFPEADVRVPEGIGELLTKQGLGDEIPKFETDLVLQRILDLHRDKLALGWMSDRWCVPRYDHREKKDPNDLDPCPVADPDELAKQPKGFEKFAFQVQNSEGFNLASSPLIATPTLVANLDNYNAAAVHSGFLNGFPDGDGVVRRGGLAMAMGGHIYPSLALEMARIGQSEGIAVDLDRRGFIESIRFAHSSRTFPVSPLGLLRINFRGAGYHFPYVPAMQLLGDGEVIGFVQDAAKHEAKRREVFDGAYVFIGVSAIGANDLRNFPFGNNAPGVEGHATILDNLLSDDMLRTSEGPFGPLGLIFVLVLGGILFALALSRLDALPGLLVFFAVAGGLSAVDFGFLFARRNVDLDSVFVYAELGSVFVVTLAVKYVLEERSKKFIRGAFSKYLAPAVVDEMLKDPENLKVGGTRKELTILFSDIRGFSGFSEKMDAPVLASFLNDYLGLMTDLVFEHEGTLDKYIGDAVMAFWGAPVATPLHAARACQAAVRMIEVLVANQARYQAEFNVRLEIGIGINTGPVNVGNLGSKRIFEYTVIGDDVNLASRIEGITKYYRCRIITTRATFDAIEKSGQPLPRHRILDSVKVKGKKNAVEMVQLLEREYDPEGLKAFEESRQLYLKREWSRAAEGFDRAATQLGTPDGRDGPSEMYLERCQDLLKEPLPPDWDGAWEMLSK